MEVLCSTTGIVSSRFPGQGLTDIARAGFSAIPLAPLRHAYSEEAVKDWHAWSCRQRKAAKKTLYRGWFMDHPEALADAIRPFCEKCRALGLTMPLAVGPDFGMPSGREEEADDLRDPVARLAEECIRIAAAFGSRYLVLPTLAVGIGGEEIQSANRVYYLRLAEFAKKQDITLLLKGQCRMISGHIVRGFCMDAAEAAEMVDSLNRAAGEERFGFCMDVGACNLCGQNLHDFVLGLGRRLKAVILSDNDGSRMASLLPFSAAYQGQSQTDWLNLIRGLRTIQFDGLLILKFGDTAASFSPILRPQLMAFAKATGDYIRWQVEMEALLRKYPSRALFGAGNMCRAYMKCYGEEFPPLFTCDNNKARWGERFCGLTVEPPERLRDLPPDAAIFICNMYYREIEEQLRGMGLSNPIEYFNDEYMPSFHFDRLEEQEAKDAENRRADAKRDK